MKFDEWFGSLPFTRYRRSNLTTHSLARRFDKYGKKEGLKVNKDAVAAAATNGSLLCYQNQWRRRKRVYLTTVPLDRRDCS